MNKSSLGILLALVLVVVGVVAGGVFFLLGGSQTGEVRLTQPEQRSTEEAVPDLPVEMEEFLVDDNEPGAATGEDPEGFLQAVRAEEPAVEEGRVLVVQVMDAETEAPAGVSDVYILDGFDGPELSDPFAQHWTALAEEYGQRFQTDARGRVELPSIQDWAIVTAHRPGLYGFAKLGPRHRDVETITLEPDETVTVRVLDRMDRPVAEVPVAVIQRVPQREDVTKWAEQLKDLESSMKKVEEYVRANPSERQAVGEKYNELRKQRDRIEGAMRGAKGGDRKADTRRAKEAKRSAPPPATRELRRAQRRTDDAGLAVFRHFQTDRLEHEEWWPPQHIDQFQAVLMLPLRQPETRAFAGNPVTSDTLELRLPPTGGLTLRTIDQDGRPFTQPVEAELRIAEVESEPWSRARVRKELDETTLEFPFAGLGLVFRLDCRLDDKDSAWSLPPFSGPGNPGEAVPLDLVVAPDVPMLFARLLDESGRPVAGGQLSFLIHSQAKRLKEAKLTLDSDGRFHLPYQVGDEHRGPFRLEMRRDEVYPPDGLVMTLPALPSQGVTDLGELHITPLAAMAQGTVLDDRGLPVEGATVRLQREREVGAKEPRQEFVNQAFTMARADEEGFYELFGEVEPGRLRLRAEAKEHFPAESAPFRPGDLVDLTLSRKSQLIGTVWTPDWMPGASVRLHLESVDDPAQRRDDQVRDANGKKYIFFDWVQPGVYHLEIRAQDFPDPVLRIDGIVVAAGQMGVHPRLQDVDLRSSLFRFEITAVDEQGRSIRPRRPLLARVVRPDGRAAYLGFPWTGQSTTKVFSASPQLDVQPLALGHVAAPTTLIHGASELRFQSIPPVEVHVPGMRKLVGDQQVWVLMTAVGETELPDRLEAWDGRSDRIARWYRDPKVNRAQLGRRDSARIPLSHNGRYRAMAYLGRIPIPLGEFDADLVPGGGPQKVTFRVDPDQVQAALDQLAQRDSKGGAGR